MPYVSESRYAELVRIEAAVGDVRMHVNAWINLLDDYVKTLPPDSPLGSGEADRSYAEHELHAMRRDLGALFPDVALTSI